MIDTPQLFSTLLTSVGIRMPVVIALGVGWVLLGDAPVGQVRRLARTALAVLVLSVIGDGLLTVLPVLLVLQGQFEAIGRYSAVVGGARLLLSLMQAAGFILLSWVTVRALRATGRN